jgi:hypothetical protein
MEVVILDGHPRHQDRCHHNHRKEVVDAVPSPKSKKLYRQAVRDFLRWYEAEAPGALSRAVVQRYRASLEARGLSASTVNVQLGGDSEAGDRGGGQRPARAGGGAIVPRHSGGTLWRALCLKY